MCSIFENYCYMSHHWKGMTSSNTAANGLDLLSKDDSNFLHSIESRQMVKILCAPLEYFQWDIMTKFTCNMRESFGTKPIREWRDDIVWKINFPNWGTYSFFKQQEIKIALYKSAVVLFIRVRE